MGEPDLQGQLDEAVEALNAALDQVLRLTTAVNQIAGVARDALEVWERQRVAPVAELSRIGEVCRNVLWTPTASGPDPGSF